MNKKQLDDLFRSKLQHSTRTPSEQAWNKLNAKLQQRKKGKGMVWLKIAAAVLLMAGVSWIILRMELSSGNDHNRVVKNDTVEKLEPLVPETQLANKTEDVQPQVKPVEIQVPKVTIAKKVEKTQIDIDKVKPEEFVVAEAITDTATKAMETLPAIDINIEEKELIAATEASEDLPEVTIIYKRGNREQDIFASANTTQPEKKSSALEKIWNVAREIKNGEIGIADIRSTKDEILAFESRKQKNQK